MRRKRDLNGWSTLTKAIWANDPEGHKKPTDNCQMKSELNGLYYNGYMFSPECAEDAFGEACEKTCEMILVDIMKGNK